MRETVGVEREDLGYREAFLSIDVERLHDLEGRYLTCEARCDTVRTTIAVPIGPHRIRFEFLANAEDDNAQLLTPEEGYRLLERGWDLTSEDVRIYRQVIYPFEGQVANDWRSGRIFIAGDAAHLMPPVLGQGACSAMRDVVNLVWKLDMVMRGIIGDDLLDTYTQERRPHVYQHVAGSIAVAELLCERDPDRAAERNELYYSGKMPPPPIDPTLTAGILRRDRQGDLLGPAGELGPQAVIDLGGRRGRFDELMGWGFHLIARGCDPLALLDEEDRALLETIGCLTMGIGEGAEADDVDGGYAAFFDEYGVEAVLVRPDFWCFGGSKTIDDIPALVRDLRDQLGVRVASLV